ncbi:MAG: hypothetical protein ACJ0DF_06390 [Paracoccaceae bacterium]
MANPELSFSIGLYHKSTYALANYTERLCILVACSMKGNSASGSFNMMRAQSRNKFGFADKHLRFIKMA